MDNEMAMRIDAIVHQLARIADAQEKRNELTEAYLKANRPDRRSVFEAVFGEKG